MEKVSGERREILKKMVWNAIKEGKLNALMNDPVRQMEWKDYATREQMLEVIQEVYDEYNTQKVIEQWGLNKLVPVNTRTCSFIPIKDAEWQENEKRRNRCGMAMIGLAIVIITLLLLIKPATEYDLKYDAYDPAWRAAILLILPIPILLFLYALSVFLEARWYINMEIYKQKKDALYRSVSYSKDLAGDIGRIIFKPENIKLYYDSIGRKHTLATALNAITFTLMVLGFLSLPTDAGAIMMIGGAIGFWLSRKYYRRVMEYYSFPFSAIEELMVLRRMQEIVEQSRQTKRHQ